MLEFLAWMEALVAALLARDFYHTQDRLRIILDENVYPPYWIAAGVFGYATAVIDAGFLNALGLGVVWLGMLSAASFGPAFKRARIRGQEDMSEFERAFAPERIGTEGYAFVLLFTTGFGLLFQLFAWVVFIPMGVGVRIAGLIGGAVLIAWRFVPVFRRSIHRVVNFFAW